MFDVVEGYQFSRQHRTRRSRYDWDTLLDGQARRVTQADLGDTQVKSFIALLYGKCKDRGVKVRTARQSDGSLILQAILPETPPSAPPAQESQEHQSNGQEESSEFVVEDSKEVEEPQEQPTPRHTRKATSRGAR